MRFPKFSNSLIVRIAYAATIGGISTPIGTAPNIVVISLIQEQGLEISFNQWILALLFNHHVTWWLMAADKCYLSSKYKS